MPIISDPGQNLVSYLRDNDYNVVIIPGVTALITAIVGSGLIHQNLRLKVSYQ